MNYISHYYLFHPAEESSFVTGLILPDITRTANKRFRLKANEKVISKEFFEIERGVNLHFKTDIIFHKAAFFKLHTAAIKQIAIECKLDGLNKYLFFFAHLIFEMMIDKILMKVQPGLPDLFYDHLNKLDRKFINHYITAKGKGEYEEAFNKFYDIFLEQQFLRNYIKEGGLAYSVLRVFNTTTKLESTIKVDDLTNFLDKTELYLQPFINEIFEYTINELGFVK